MNILQMQNVYLDLLQWSQSASRMDEPQRVIEQVEGKKSRVVFRRQLLGKTKARGLGELLAAIQKRQHYQKRPVMISR